MIMRLGEDMNSWGYMLVRLVLDLFFPRVLKAKLVSTIWKCGIEGDTSPACESGQNLATGVGAGRDTSVRCGSDDRALTDFKNKKRT